MGIKFLSTLIKKEGYIKCISELRNKYLVIDALNFAFTVCQKCTEGYYYTWNDCDVAYNAIFDFINDFKSCGITPIFVFENSVKARSDYVSGAKKIQRNSVEIKRTITKKRDYSRAYVQNLLKQVMRDLNIKEYVALSGKHGAMAFLAQKLNCPIVSLDTAFCIYDVDFILLESLEMCRATKSFKASMFDRKSFLELEGLTQETLPIAAAVAGNEFTDDELLNAVFGRRNFTDMFLPLKGLNFQKGIRAVIRACPEQHRARMTDAVIKSVEHYTPVCSFRADELKELLPDYVAEDNFEVTEWAFEISPRLKKLFSAGSTRGFYKLAARNELSLCRFIEYEAAPDIYENYIILIRGIYTFMQRNNENKVETTVAMRVPSAPDLSIFGNPLVMNANIRVIPDLNIGSGPLDEAERKAIFYRILEFKYSDIDVVEMFPPDWQTFVTCLLYAIKKRIICPYQVYAVLASVLITKIVQEKTNFYRTGLKVTNTAENTKKKSRIVRLMEEIEVTDCELIAREFSSKKFRKGTTEIRGPNLAIMHGVSALLAGIKLICSLGKIVGYPGDFRSERFLCGSLMYYFLKLWCKGPTETLKGRAIPVFRQLSVKIMELYEAIIDKMLPILAESQANL